MRLENVGMFIARRIGFTVWEIPNPPPANRRRAPDLRPYADLRFLDVRAPVHER